MTNPHLEYVQTPNGKMPDWKAFSRDYPKETGPIGTGMPDRRDTRNAEQLGNEILARRNGAIQADVPFPEEKIFHDAEQQGLF